MNKNDKLTTEVTEITFKAIHVFKSSALTYNSLNLKRSGKENVTHKLAIKEEHLKFNSSKPGAFIRLLSHSRFYSGKKCPVPYQCSCLSLPQRPWTTESSKFYYLLRSACIVSHFRLLLAWYLGWLSSLKLLVCSRSRKLKLTHCDPRKILCFVSFWRNMLARLIQKHAKFKSVFLKSINVIKEMVSL